MKTFFFSPQTTKTVTKNTDNDDKIKDIKPAQNYHVMIFY